MSITCRLSDGTQTVNLNDGTTLRLGAAFQQNTGGGSVTELIICGWVDGVTTDQKAATMRDITQLIRKGVRHFRERKIDQAVWMDWKPDTATSVQYAKIMGGGVVEIDTNTVGGRDGGVLQIEVVREGFWRSVSPYGGSGTEVVTASTIYNKSDTDGDNWVSIAARDIDAPGLLWFQVAAGQNYNAVEIARRVGTTTDLNNFNPHFNPTDGVTSFSTAADTSAPEDVRVVVTGTDTTNEVHWTLTADQIPMYVGRFAVYCWVQQQSGAGSITAAFQTEQGAVLQGGAVDVPDTGSVGKVYLGAFGLPGVSINPFESQSNSEITLGIAFVITGTATAWLRGMWLVPLEFPPFRVEAGPGSESGEFLSAYWQIVDGINQITYQLLDSTPDVQKVNGTMVTQGVYPVLEANTVNRFYFYFEDDGEHEFNDTSDITVEVIDRFETLRGGA